MKRRSLSFSPSLRRALVPAHREATCVRAWRADDLVTAQLAPKAHRSATGASATAAADFVCLKMRLRRLQAFARSFDRRYDLGRHLELLALLEQALSRTHGERTENEKAAPKERPGFDAGNLAD